MSMDYGIMKIEDYYEMYRLWESIPEMNLNAADERERIDLYLCRNPGQSFVCKADGHIIGTIMCGNDGRRAFIYHLAVSEQYRNRGIARKLVRRALDEQKILEIDKCAVFILDENRGGKEFWMKMGFSAVCEAETMAKRI